MTGNVLFWLQFIFSVNAATFFHDMCYEKIAPPETGTDFGQTLAYHSNMQSLVVGAPFSDPNGKVYLCSINDDLLKNNKTVCSKIPINIDKEVPNYSRSKSPEQNFGLGSSISVTPEYIFICAPLLTLDIALSNSTKFGAFGTCFITYDGVSTYRYVGLMEQFEKDMNGAGQSKININDIYGGVGWSTFADVVNKLILIAKPSLFSTLHYIDMEKPLATAKLVGESIISSVKVAYNSFKYKGTAFAQGEFFKGHRLYAFSADDDRKRGIIAFLSYDAALKKMRLLTSRSKRIVVIKGTKEGAMFGASLHSANVDNDKYTDLIVGAPAHVNTDGGYENGAIFVYLGGDLRGQEMPSLKTLCIYSTKDASRFGTSIATADLDGDGHPEIFVSAPYEDDLKGAVYIFSGHEVKEELLKSKKLSSKLSISKLIYTQRIQDPNLQSLGFSLQVLPVPQFEEFGQYFLAMGSPMSGQVALYRSIPLITVNVTTQLKGIERVREQDREFTVSVIVDITFPPKLKLTTGKILVTTSISGDDAWIENGTDYEIQLSETTASTGSTSNATDVVVKLGNFGTGFYKFYAAVRSDTENLKRTKDFDPSLVDISPRSNTSAVLPLMRECKLNEADCEPNLSLNFDWSGGNKTHYTLGSNALEVMTLVIRNDGGATFGSCARIKVTGVKIAGLDCKMEDGWHRCDLISIKRYKELRLPVSLDMSKPTNDHKSLRIDVLLYNNCTSNPNKENYTETIFYEFNTDEIYFNSTYYNHIITDREIEDVESGPYIEINEFYTITNKANMLWSSLPLEIHLEEESFIKDYLIQVDSSVCIKGESNLKYNCIVDLKPNSTITVKSAVTIFKNKIMERLKDKKIKVVSNFKLYMKPSLKTLENIYLTEIVYQETVGLQNNVYIVVAISVLLGVFVMAVISIILSKGGFFKRAEKQRLASLKHEIRKQSIRRPTMGDVLQVVLEPSPEQLNENDNTAVNLGDQNHPGVDGISQRKKVHAAQQEGSNCASRSSNS